MGSEFELIAELQAATAQELPAGWIGIGDDCAVLEVRPDAAKAVVRLALSVDTQVQGVHFRKSYFSPADIGWRSLTVALSDIAAMGASPLNCLISLQRSAAESDSYLQEVYQGVAEAAREFHCPVIGGDTVQSETFALSVTVVGQSPSPYLLRSNAVDGDDIWVSGQLGGAALGFQLLEADEDAQRGALSQPDCDRLVQRHLRPVPQFSLVSMLREHGFPHAMIDISDGVFADAEHVSKASGLGLELDWQLIPVDTSVSEGLKEKMLALTHGDDYELLFSAPQRFRTQLAEVAKSPDKPFILTRIGTATTASRGVSVLFEEEQYSIEEFVKLAGCQRSGYQHS